MDICTKILELLSFIQYKDLFFELKIFKNAEKELRIAYVLPDHVLWDNPFLDKICAHLVMCENINTDKQLFEAIDYIFEFLKKHKL